MFYSVMPVLSNATQRMYNIQFNLLISQHVSTVFRSSSGEYKCLQNALFELKTILLLIWVHIYNNCPPPERSKHAVV
jgi:hypothetical protein